MIWFTPGAEQGLLEDRRIHLFCSDEKYYCGHLEMLLATVGL